MRPFVSIIIPCRNEAASLGRCLDSILASGYPPHRMEVIVADGMSTDGSRALLQAFAARDGRVRVLENPERITPIALNRAIKVSRGDFILRVDAHSTISPSYIAELVEFLAQNPEAWGAGGRMNTASESRGTFSEAISIVLSHRFGVGNSTFRTGSDGIRKVDTVFNCCWRRDVFRRAGLFHEQLVRSQDIEMSSRIAAAGGTLWLIPHAGTIYFARTRFGAFLRHNWSNGIWSLVPAIFLGRLPVSLRHLIPLFFVAAILLSVTIRAIVPKWSWLLLLPVLPYVLLNLLVSIHAAWRRRSTQLLWLLPISFAGLHLAYGAGSLWGAMRVGASLLQRFTSTPARNPTTI